MQGRMVDFPAMAEPRRLEEVAAALGVSRATMWRWVAEFRLTKYHVPGRGKATHLDPDEVRRKVKPRKVTH
jgi:transposase-like protein